MVKKGAVISYGVIAANADEKQLIERLFDDKTVITDTTGKLVFELARNKEGEILGFGVELVVADNNQPTELMTSILHNTSAQMKRAVKSLLFSISIRRDPELFLWIYYSENS